MVAQGKFREDLYYRLNVVNIELPSLRERIEDLKELVAHFIGLYNRKFGKNVKGITAEALAQLENRTWPGNIRELANTIQEAVLYCPGEHLSLKCKPLMLQDQSSCDSVELAVRQLAQAMFSNNCQDRFQEVIGMFEREMVRKALEVTAGNQVQSARLLGISRNTLRKKLEPGDGD